MCDYCKQGEYLHKRLIDNENISITIFFNINIIEITIKIIKKNKTILKTNDLFNRNIEFQNQYIYCYNENIKIHKIDYYKIKQNKPKYHLKEVEIINKNKVIIHKLYSIYFLKYKIYYIIKNYFKTNKINYFINNIKLLLF